MSDVLPEPGEDARAAAARGDTGLATAVRTALARVIDPEIRKPITELDMVGGVQVDAAGLASVDLKLTIVGCPAASTIERDVRQAAAGVPGVRAVDVAVSVMTKEERQALTEKLRGPGGPRTMPFGPGSLTRVYAVTSGKGGVGKSTLTANLAVALAARGLAVGLVDADVYGFSIPGILGLVDEHGVAARPTRVDDMILPPVAHGVKVISIGMFIDPEQSSATGGAVAWRGPMLHRTITQFLTDVYFGDLDVLLLDLPPGTGDVAISIGQLLPNAEVIVLTTPQPAAADVAERSGLVAMQTGQHVYGVIENMAGYAAPDGTVVDLFGAGGGAEVARRLSDRQQAATAARTAAGATGAHATHDGAVPLLASVPISVALRSGGDAGAPVVLAHPTDPAAVAIASVADRIARRGRGLAGRKLGLAPA
ncbi:ATP-binding protein involved in chromosome partitioning [Herbiconiux flava]|uniref:Iron-sulfur cluster carrier protein n=1 Tax=Herbiconiux flava TaxID=881268 RepID=A0A852SSD8_9MICO|nr:ATP-binding protein involved in chromosome partitioning [Herbiconiux flava]GLK18211.1 iron-sulfur cluster carrier protein [Herbiconiux flava]